MRGRTIGPPRVVPRRTTARTREGVCHPPRSSGCVARAARRLEDAAEESAAEPAGDVQPDCDLG